MRHETWNGGPLVSFVSDVHRFTQARSLRTRGRELLCLIPDVRHAGRRGQGHAVDGWPGRGTQLSEAPEGTIHIYNKFWERTRY